MIPRFGVFILVFLCTIMMEATMEKGQMEAHISTSMITFQRKQLGRGAESAKTYIIDDMIVIRLKGVLTAAEKRVGA